MNRNSEKQSLENADEALVRRFVNDRDESAFDEMVRKYADRVFNICFRMMGDYDDASDCAQEVFIKVYSKLDSFRFRSQLVTWLYRIAINTCKNHLSSSYGRMSRKALRIDGVDGPLPGEADGKKNGCLLHEPPPVL